MSGDIGVSRKKVKEDRIAICPKYGCEYITRVKPLKFRFFGFGKHPKCKKHHLYLVYVDEMIGDFIDGALACFFDKSALPPSDLLKQIRVKFPEEMESFVRGWTYCITTGRGGQIASRYMDGISKGYLKQLSRKQKRVLKKGDDGNADKISKAIKDGLKEVTNQYTRLLKHLRIHSEILNNPENLKSPSKSLRNFLNEWQKSILKNNDVLNNSENMREMSLLEIKQNYDEILNIGTCRCFIGQNPESRGLKKAKITEFDRFSAYLDFYKDGLVEKFTKSVIDDLVKTTLPSKEENEELKNMIGKLDIKEEDVKMVQKSKLKEDCPFPLRLSEEGLEEKARKWKLRLLSDYKKEYKNRDSVLRWKCKECKNEFEGSVGYLRNYKYPCPACRKIKRERERCTPFYDDSKCIKECSHCNKILPFSSFYKRSGSRGNCNESKNFQSRCKECCSTSKNLRKYKKKLKLISEFFRGKCNECGQDLNFLSMAHFHHPFPEYKTAEWKDVLHMSYSNIVNWAKQDSVILLCSNCHKKEEAKLYKKFKKLILEKEIFNKNPEELNELLAIGKRMTSNEKTKIQKWLRKRYIIERVFGGKCIGCRKVNITNCLSSLTFHHRDNSIKNVEIEQILRDNNCETIYNIILKENAVCLCANCHSLLDTKLHLHLDEIFDESMEEFKNKYKMRYKKLINNINRFQFNHLEIKSPLKLEFGHKEIWELNLLEVYFFLQENHSSNFWIKEFINSFNYERQYANEIMRKLENKGFVRRLKEKKHIQAKYEMTEYGMKIVPELIRKHKNVAGKIQKQAKLKESNFLDENERTLSYNDVNERYPFHIFKLILQNGYNEFTNNQLAIKVERQARTINNHLKEILIPKEIVENVKIPLYIQTFQYNNVFRLTNKGYQLIKKYFKKSPTFKEINKIDVKNIKNDLIRYSIFIFKLTQGKGYNEFIKTEIYELAQTEQKDLGRFTGYLLRTKLIPEGIIKEVQNPQLLARNHPNNKAYELTEKGISLAKKFMKYD